MKTASSFALGLGVLGLGLAMGLAQNASASPVLHSLYCSSVNSGPDHGLILSVDYNMSARSHVATLSTQSIAGPRLLAHYEPLTVSDRRPVDGPLVYRGRGFSITVPSGMSPRKPVSKLVARLAGSNGRVLRADMKCWFPR